MVFQRCDTVALNDRGCIPGVERLAREAVRPTTRPSHDINRPSVDPREAEFRKSSSATADGDDHICSKRGDHVPRVPESRWNDDSAPGVGVVHLRRWKDPYGCASSLNGRLACCFHHPTSPTGDDGDGMGGEHESHLSCQIEGVGGRIGVTDDRRLCESWLCRMPLRHAPVARSGARLSPF